MTKFQSLEIADKIQGLEILTTMFGNCGTFHNQLKLFAIKS
jgi:hypothetical protein